MESKHNGSLALQLKQEKLSDRHLPIVPLASTNPRQMETGMLQVSQGKSKKKQKQRQIRTC
jgi:hypothetical protein